MSLIESFSETKKCFQKKAASKEFHYSSERPRTGISKPNDFKAISLLSRNFKLNYPRNKVILKNVLYCGRRNQSYLDKIGTPDKNPFSNQIVSREWFLCARKLILKSNKNIFITANRSQRPFFLSPWMLSLFEVHITEISGLKSFCFTWKAPRSVLGIQIVPVDLNQDWIECYDNTFDEHAQKGITELNPVK